MSTLAHGVEDYGVVPVRAGMATVQGELVIPVGARGVVLFAHGSGSSRHSPRNRYVAARLQRAGLATFLLDLLTPDERFIDEATKHFRFDSDLLAERLVAATDQLALDDATAGLVPGYFGAGFGARAALTAASRRPERVGAVVSRGSWLDPTDACLGGVRAPTLLLVGAADATVRAANREAMEHIHGSVRLDIVPGATNTFREPGALARVGAQSASWFLEHLTTRTAPSPWSDSGVW